MPELSGVVQGEKEWQGWAQNHVDWLDQRTEIASTRSPYVSTLVQLGNQREMSEEQAVKAFDNIMIDDGYNGRTPEKVENDLPNTYELT
jgi:hypothetical protein